MSVRIKCTDTPEPFAVSLDYINDLEYIHGKINHTKQQQAFAGVELSETKDIVIDVPFPAPLFKNWKVLLHAPPTEISMTMHCNMLHFCQFMGFRNEEIVQKRMIQKMESGTRGEFTNVDEIVLMGQQVMHFIKTDSIGFHVLVFIVREIVKLLKAAEIESDIDFNTFNLDLDTRLILWGAIRGQPENILRWFHSHGLDILTKKYDPWYDIDSDLYFSTFVNIIDEENYNDYIYTVYHGRLTMLQFACKTQNWVCVRKLLEGGAFKNPYIVSLSPPVYILIQGNSCPHDILDLFTDELRHLDPTFLRTMNVRLLVINHAYALKYIPFPQFNIEARDLLGEWVFELSRKRKTAFAVWIRENAPKQTLKTLLEFSFHDRVKHEFLVMLAKNDVRSLHPCQYLPKLWWQVFPVASLLKLPHIVQILQHLFNAAIEFESSSIHRRVISSISPDLMLNVFTSSDFIFCNSTKRSWQACLWCDILLSQGDKHVRTLNYLKRKMKTQNGKKVRASVIRSASPKVLAFLNC